MSAFTPLTWFLFWELKKKKLIKICIKYEHKSTRRGHVSLYCRDESIANDRSKLMNRFSTQIDLSRVAENDLFIH